MKSLPSATAVSPCRCAIAALGLLAGSALAQPVDGAAALRVSGFGTYGFVHADAPAGWGFRRDIAQPGGAGSTRADIDSRLGLQLNYAPTPQFEWVGQVIAMRRSPYAPASDGIEWAFGAYRPQPDITLRVGRLNLDQFLLSDYRNVGFAYSFVRPPVDFYGSLPTSLDGADLARSWNDGAARWRLKGYVGQARSGDLSHDARTEVRPAFGAMASREADGLLLRVGYSHVRLATSAPAVQPLLDGLAGVAGLPLPDVAAQAAALRERLDNSGKQASYATVGLNYDVRNWQWSAEYARVSGDPGLNFSTAYVSLGRRIGAATLYAGFSGIRSEQSPIDAPAWGDALTPLVGADAAQQIQALGNAAVSAVNLSAANQHTATLGVRWDLHAQLALKLQWDHVRIGAWGGRLWANPSADASRADVASATLDFVF